VQRYKKEKVPTEEQTVGYTLSPATYSDLLVNRSVTRVTLDP